MAFYEYCIVPSGVEIKHHCGELQYYANRAAHLTEDIFRRLLDDSSNLCNDLKILLIDPCLEVSTYGKFENTE